MKLTENDLRLLIRGILSEQVEEEAEEAAETEEEEAESEDSEGTEESGGDYESKILELIASGNGVMARELAVTLQLNLNDAFFRKLIDYGVDLLQPPPFRPGNYMGNPYYFVISCPKPPKNPQWLSPARLRELEKTESAWRRWESFSGGVDDFFMNKNKKFSIAARGQGKGRHVCRGGLLFDPTNPQKLQHQLDLMDYYWEQIKSADDKPISESVDRRWQLLAGIKE